MDDDYDDFDLYSRDAEDLSSKSESGNVWDRDVPGEYAGEFDPQIPEQGETVILEKYETPVESEYKLPILQDPKLYLMEQVKAVLYNLITDRPENVIDYFEEYVRNIIMKDRDKQEPVLSAYAHYFEVEKLIEESYKWIIWKEEASNGEMGGEGAAMKKEYIFQNRMENFEDAGLSLTKLETFGVAFALQTAPHLFEVENIRFWGKIFGLYKNYYVLEAEVSKKILMKAREEEKENKIKPVVEELRGEAEEEYRPKIKWHRVRTLAQYVKPPMPKSTFLKPKFAPKERLGTGVNKKIYYVSNEPAEGYVRLPDVTPVEIVKARQIKRFFTGILDEEVNSDPPFPGKEINYLRAQIARISAGTHISPLGYYSFDVGEGGYDENEEEDEEDEGDFKMKLPKPEYTINPDYEPMPLPDIVDPSMAFWVHHTAHILPQGRAVWIDPTIDPTKPKPEGEDFIKREKPEKEVGPPLLTATSDDMSLEMIPPWSTRLAIELAPTYGPAVVRSNLWLGAIAYALSYDVSFDNAYFGWGLKHNACSFTPISYFIPQKEYEIGPEVMEATDPDPEEEDYEGILYRLNREQQIRQKLEDDEQSLVLT